MTEEAMVVDLDGVRMHAVLHVPRRESWRDGRPHGQRDARWDAGRRPLILFVGDPRWDCGGPHRLFVEAAREFCDDGFACYRFDTVGEEEARDVGIRSVAEGETYIDVVMQVLGSLPRTVGYAVNECILLGFCAGADLCANVAAFVPVRGLALWSVRLSKYAFREGELSRYVSAEELESFDRGAMIARVEAIRGSAAEERPAGALPVLIVNGERYSTASADAEALDCLYPSERYQVRYECLPKGDQFFSSAAVASEAVAATRRWLAESFPCDESAERRTEPRSVQG